LSLRIVNRASAMGRKKLEKSGGGPPLLLFSEADVQAIRESLADFVCSRCRQKYRDHWNADHFFEYVEDLDSDKAD
jgi:hypothetical protein